MQTCFLVATKETQIASYLQHRSILDVVEEHRSLTEINMEQLNIVDVDKLLYVYYPTDDGDLSFRSDMNALRTLMASAFFHVTEIIFILIDSTNPLIEDLIYSALRNAPITRDKIDIIRHTGSLMLPDVGKYLAGSASGQISVSSYQDVYVREADKEERDRFPNTPAGLDAVLPVLTDMSALYAQRASVEAISAGRVVTEVAERPQVVMEFSRVRVDATKTMTSFVVSGDDWTGAYRGVRYLVEYAHVVGRRCLVVNLQPDLDIAEVVGSCRKFDLMELKSSTTPENPIAVVNARFNQLGFIVEFLQNIRGVEQYIFYCPGSEYGRVCKMIRQLSENVYTTYVAHHNEASVKNYLASGYNSTVVFLSFERLSEQFSLQSYKKDFEGTVVAAFPTEDVDYFDYYTYSTGGGGEN